METGIPQAELLAPAGSYEGMKAALAAGADAVYIGGPRFGARAYADNPDGDGLRRAIAYAHEKRKKLYLAVNTLLKDSETEELYGYLNPLYREGLDAVIVQDLGVLRYVRDVFPKMHIHASTQMGITGAYGAQFLKEQGASRVVTARELSLQEIRQIRGKTDVEIESFVHGALCFCYSGQCLFSSMVGGRSGNRGRCAQPCRLPYELMTGDRTAHGIRDGQTVKTAGRYLLSPKDICALDILPELIKSGISSFKIEGRMKRAEYAAGVTAVYRRCLDRYYADGEGAYRVAEKERRVLLDLYNRGGFSDGYYRRHNGPEMMAVKRPNHHGIPAAKVLGVKAGRLTVQALETLHAGDVLEYRTEDRGRGGFGGSAKTPVRACAELTVDRTVAAGETWQLPAAAGGAQKRSAGAEKNDVLYRTHNEFLLQELRQKYLCAESAEKINGKLILSAKKPAILELYYGDYKIRAQGRTPDAAKSRPLLSADAEKQMRKTGGSGFAFDRISVEMEDGLFMPVQALNELRRDALTELRDQIAGAHRREDGTYRPSERARSESCGARGPRAGSGPQPAGAHGGEKPPALTASLENAECLAALCAVPGISRIYLDCNSFESREQFLADSERRIALCHASGKACWYILPWIFRREALDFFDGEAVSVLSQYDGVLIRNQEECAFLRACGYDKDMAADWNLYTFNREARAFWREAGLVFDTASPELNRRELAARGCRDSELIVYGHQPLMVSAQCQVKNVYGCKRQPQTLWLRDRMQKRFAVRSHCLFCYSMILNGTPLELIKNAEDIRGLHPDSVRLQFTGEDAGTAAQIASSYADVFVQNRPSAREILEFTRGHFERGVE